MRLLGKAWRLLVGVKDALVLILLLLFFAALYAALSSAPSVGAGQTGALVLDIRGTIVEQPAQADPLDVLTGGSPLIREYRLRDVVHALETGATDDRVKAVALDLDSFLGTGQASLEAVSEALRKVRRSGKPIIAYATAYTDDSYHLAAHASEIWLNPLGAVFIAGPGGTNLYFKGLLDKLGVTANVYRVGAYKSAVEPYTRSDMSPEARRSTQALAAALWENWLADVRRARPKAQLAAYVAAPGDRFAEAGGDMARAALRAGLVDRIGDRTEVGKRLAQIAGTDNEAVPGSFKALAYDAWVASNPATDGGGSIGVVTVAGTIMDGEAGPGTAGAETIVQAISTGLRDKPLKALVVRVDSPGGSTTGSERIRQAVLDAKAKGIPVVVSMGSVAASGGYWIATAGDRIYAEPETITGSIGVFGIIPSFEGTLQKLGIGADGVKTTPLSGEPDLLRGPSEQADRLIQMGVNATYARFLALVSRSRKLPVPRVNEIAQGRVWDGGMARQLGLVDGFGGLDEAVAEAARRANIDPDEAKLVYLEKEPGLIDQLFSSLGGGTEAAVGRDSFSRAAVQPQLLLLSALAEAQKVLAGPAIQARCLECPPVALNMPIREQRSLFGWLASVLVS